MKEKPRMPTREINNILESGILSGFRAYDEYHLGGKYVREFEDEFKAYFEVKYAISLNSATAALHSALIACGIGSGDNVVVTPYSFSSSASCVLMVGARPVFVDIDDKTFNMDMWGKNLPYPLKAIIPVHLCGHPVDMNPLMAWARYHDIKVIEDCAQAIGAEYNGRKVGTLADCGVFSFNQSKHINTGEGGMLITNDDDIARKVRAVRNHGEVSDPELKQVGWNYRMCEIEAAIGLKQFKGIDKNISHRIKLANYLTKRLSDVKGLTPPVVHQNCRHSYYTYAVKVEGIDKDVLCKELRMRGIYFGGYVKPLHLLPIYEQFGYKEGDMPVAERMWKTELIVTDTIRPEATLEDMDKIIKAFKEIM